MSALSQNSVVMTEVDYLVFERSSDIKHEYLSGEVFAMTGASRAHNLICTNIVATLHPQLRTKPCEVYQSDMRLKVQATSLITYPDVSIVCEEPQFVDDEFDTLLNPIVIIEVLSPSTERYDRGKKFQDYRQISSLQEYLIVAQDSSHIERYLRQEDGAWTLTDAVGLDTDLELPSIACTLALADVYAKVTLK